MPSEDDIRSALTAEIAGRDLTQSQKAMIGAKAIQRIKAEDPSARIAAIVAQIVGVSIFSMRLACRSLEVHPEEAHRVESGEISTSKLLGRTDERRVPPRVTGRPGIESRRDELVCNSHKQRFLDAIAQISGLCRGLDSVNLANVKTASTAEELALLSRTIRRLCGRLTNIRKVIREREVAANEEAEN